MKTQNKQPILLSLISLALAGCVTHAQMEQEKEKVQLQENLHQQIAEHSENIQQIQAQMGQLQGQVENALHKRQEVDLENQKKFEDKILLLEKQQKILFAEIKKLKKEGIRSFKRKAYSPKPSFKKAMNAYNKKQYSSAATKFQAFIDKYPKSKNHARANYYLGESLFQQKKYREAILAYNITYEKVSRKQKLWRKTTLKIAQAFKKIGKKGDAKIFAQELVNQSPKSSEAKKAKKYL